MNDYHVQALQALIDKEKIIILGMTTNANRDISDEDVARASRHMHEDYLAGDYIDITNTPI